MEKVACFLNLLTLYVLLSICGISNGWGCPGHMIVAQIARNKLESVSTEYVTLLDTVIKHMNEPDQPYNYLELACFADDIISTGFGFFNTWHYWDHPIYDGKINQEKISKPNHTTSNSFYFEINY